MAISGGPPEDDNAAKRSTKPLGVYREYGPYLTLGIQLAAAVVIFLVVGVWADSNLGTSPLFTLLGLLLGSAGGFIKFFKTVSQLEQKDRPSSRNGAP